MNFGSKHTDYYTGYNSNTFFAIGELQRRVPKIFVNAELLNAAIFWFTNIERKKHGQTQFQFHRKLEQMAMLHSEQMRKHKFFDHENKYDIRFRTLRDRLEHVKDGGFNGFMSFAENIADCPVIKANESFTYTVKDGVVHFYTMDGKEFFPYTYAEMAQSVVDAWMNSPGHRANILNPNYRYLGCGCAPYEDKKDGYSITYFKLTQNFGGELVSPSIIETAKQTIQTVLNPHGEENKNKVKSNALFGGWGQSKISKDMATNQGLSYNVDIVFCIDVTGSMTGVLETVKTNALKFYPDLMDQMEKKGKWVDKLRIKVIAFRDFEADKENALEILDFVDLPEKQEEFRSFVTALKPQGGGPEPENGLEALALAMDSDWNKGGDKQRHVIVVYSDASTHSLEEKSGYKPDGMPSNFNELTDWWEQGKMDAKAKRLILFAPDAASWTDIATYWDQVIHYPSTAGGGLSEVDYDTIIKTVANSI